MALGLLLLTAVGVLGCVTALTLFAFVTYAVATSKEPVFGQSSQGGRSKIAIGTTVALSLLISGLGIYLYALPFLREDYSFFSSETNGPIFYTAIGVHLLLPAIAVFWAVSTDCSTMSKSKKFHGQLTYASGAIALFLIFNMFLCMAVYGVETLQNHNFARNSSSYYHGPAPIVAGTASGSYSSRVKIAYGGEWACPGNPTKETCYVETSLSPCSKFDVSSKTSYWRKWNHVDHWKNSFSCADGPLDKVYGNQGNDDGNHNGYVSYIEDGFDASDVSSWPYRIHIIADCRDTCLAMVDDLYTRELLFSVDHLKRHMLLNGLGAMAFLLLGPAFRRMFLSSSDAEEAKTHLVDEEKEGELA